MRRLALLLVLVALACGAGASVSRAGGPYGSIKVGTWHGGAYTDKDGAFEHCSATNLLPAGPMLVTRTAGGALLFAVTNPAWHLRSGRSMSLVDAAFDGEAPLHFQAIVASAHEVGLVVAPAAAAERLAKARTMTLVIGGQSYDFAVDTVGQVVPVLDACVAKVKSAGIASAGTFSAPPGKGGEPKAGTDAAPAPAAGSKEAAAKPAPAPEPEHEQPEKRERAVNVSGTGFVVSTSGHVVTNDHVIRDCVGTIHGSFPNGKPMTLRVASSDQLNDLALLQATGSFPDVAAIRGTAIHSGEPVIAIGFPYHGLLTSDFTVTTGIVSSLSGLLNDTRYLQTSAPIQPGNSGGPLLDAGGAVAGVAAAKLNALKFAGMVGGDIPQNVNFAIKIGALRDFLDNSAVPYKTADSAAAAALKTDEVAAKARSYIMLIACKAKATAKD